MKRRKYIDYESYDANALTTAIRELTAEKAEISRELQRAEEAQKLQALDINTLVGKAFSIPDDIDPNNVKSISYILITSTDPDAEITSYSDIANGLQITEYFKDDGSLNYMEMCTPPSNPDMYYIDGDKLAESTEITIDEFKMKYEKFKSFVEKNLS
jgi:hypothetical protein